jgi:hypothetical protein
MKKTIFIGVPGIRNFPGDDKNWVGRFVTHIQTKTPFIAEKVEYYSLAITRFLHNKKRANKLYRTLSFYKDYNIVIFCHSNGGDLVLDCLNYYNDWPNIKCINFICSAGEADFNKNNLNKQLKDNRIDKVNLYIAKNDKALKLAHTFWGKILGYGVMGLNGGKNISDDIKDKVNTYSDASWDKYGHSECFKDENFEQTMDLLINNSINN